MHYPRRAEAQLSQKVYELFVEVSGTELGSGSPPSPLNKIINYKNFIVQTKSAKVVGIFDLGIKR